MYVFKLKYIAEHFPGCCAEQYVCYLITILEQDHFFSRENIIEIFFSQPIVTNPIILNLLSYSMDKIVFSDETQVKK